MKLNNKVYDVLKWIVMIALPAFSLFIGTVGTDIGITDVDVVVKILNAVTALLGGLIGVSTYSRNKEE